MVEFLIKDLSDPKIAKFAGVTDFDFVQLDPFGGIATPAGFLQGRPLYKPKEDKLGQVAGAYQGSHAFLVKRSALHKINKFMDRSKATMVEKIPQRLDGFIAVGGGMATSPKSPFFMASTASKSCKADGFLQK